MRTFLFIIFSILSLASFAQRADGFFIQELSFIDINLLKANKIDKLEIEVFQNGLKVIKREIYLDSNTRKTREVISSGDSILSTDYSSTVIAQYACPSVKPTYIKACVSDKIIKAENGGAYSENRFDSLGRPIVLIWKPNPKALEMSRNIFYASNDLIDSIKIDDFREDRSIDKTELLIYKYSSEILAEIAQFIRSGNNYQQAGKIRFKNYSSGLVKSFKGDAYYGLVKMKGEFKYYKNGILVL